MTSAINEDAIDTAFPVAGVDNDSQGFRDNFSSIRTALGTARGEITTLQDYTAKIGNADSTIEVVNNFGGNIISNAKTSGVYANAYETYAVNNTNVSWNDGEYQAIEMRGDYKLTFIAWPEADGYGKMRIELKSNGVARTVTFAAGSGYSLKKEIGTALVTVAGAVRNASTTPTATTKFSFPTASFTTITNAGFQVGNLLTGSGLTNDVVISAVDNITTTATATATALTINYTGIVTGADTVINMGAAITSINELDPIQLSDVTGVTGVGVSPQIYYAHLTGGGNIQLSSSSSAYVAVPSSGTYTVIDPRTATFRQSANSNGVTLNTTGMYVNMPIRFIGSTISTVAIGGVSGQFTCTATRLVIGNTVKITGTNAGTGSISSYASGTIYKISAITGSGSSVTGFTLINTNDTAITTTAGTTTGLTFAVVGVGGVGADTDYYVHSIIDPLYGVGVRLSLNIGGDPIPLTDTVSSPGTLTMVPRTVLTTTFNSQTASAGSGLTLTTNVQGVPTPFTVDADTTKVKIIEVWKQPYSDVVFLKYLGEFA